MYLESVIPEFNPWLLLVISSYERWMNQNIVFLLVNGRSAIPPRLFVELPMCLKLLSLYDYNEINK